MSDNWVVQNLENALETWNSKLSEIWQLLTTSPQQFKGGSIWSVMVNISAQWVQRSADGLIRENAFRLNLGITFNERWFMKWKLE